MADKSETTVVCPYCGDETEQDVVLDEFTCGNCDEPFSTKPKYEGFAEAYRRRAPKIKEWDEMQNRVREYFARKFLVDQGDGR